MCCGNTLSPPVLDRYSSVVQIACHPLGFGMTPNKVSGIAAYYSATAQFVKWISQLSQPSKWTSGQDLSSPQTWRSLNLTALTHTHTCLFQNFQCVERNQQDHTASNDAPPSVHAPFTKYGNCFSKWALGLVLINNTKTKKNQGGLAVFFVPTKPQVLPLIY